MVHGLVWLCGHGRLARNECFLQSPRTCVALGVMPWGIAALSRGLIFVFELGPGWSARGSQPSAHFLRY